MGAVDVRGRALADVDEAFLADAATFFVVVFADDRVLPAPVLAGAVARFGGEVDDVALGDGVDVRVLARPAMVPPTP